MGDDKGNGIQPSLTMNDDGSLQMLEWLLFRF